MDKVNIMRKSQLFELIKTIVIDECEISESELLSGTRTADVVDARYILVKCLNEQGMYPADIATFLPLKQRTISHILSNFDSRIRYGYYIRINYANVRQAIGKNLLMQ